MKTKGVRIIDKVEGVINVTLLDILREVSQGDSFFWSILFMSAIGHLGDGKSIVDFQKQIYESEKGFFISWNDLTDLSKKFHQVIDIILIGCKNKKLLQRYEQDQDMYETCDIVIQMIDSSYWEIFSNDEDFLNRLSKKFKDILFIESDFIP